MLIDGDALHRHRDKMLMSQEDFAREIGVGRSWLQMTEKQGRRRVLRKVVAEIAKRLKVDPAELILPELTDSESAITPAEVEKFEIVKSRRYPIFNVSITAGRWIETTPHWKDDAHGYLPLPSTTPDDAFVVRIIGDCMIPDYPSGSVIVFAPVREPGTGVEFENGRDYYFEHSDGKATFKRVTFDADAEEYILTPLNPAYSPFRVPAQMMARLSRAIKLIRDL